MGGGLDHRGREHRLGRRPGAGHRAARRPRPRDRRADAHRPATRRRLVLYQTRASGDGAELWSGATSTDWSTSGPVPGGRSTAALRSWWAPVGYSAAARSDRAVDGVRRPLGHGRHGRPDRPARRDRRRPHRDRLRRSGPVVRGRRMARPRRASWRTAWTPGTCPATSTTRPPCTLRTSGSTSPRRGPPPRSCPDPRRAILGRGRGRVAGRDRARWPSSAPSAASSTPAAVRRTCTSGRGATLRPTGMDPGETIFRFRSGQPLLVESTSGCSGTETPVELRSFDAASGHDDAARRCHRRPPRCPSGGAASSRGCRPGSGTTKARTPGGCAPSCQLSE